MLTLRPLKADNPADRVRLQAVLEAAPAYSRLVRGRLPLAADTIECFEDLPPGLTQGDKLVGGFWLGEEMVGCLDLCRGYPRVDIAYIGLLVFAESCQGLGFGREALDCVYQVAQGWGCSVLRLAVIETNSPALGFWRHLGFGEVDRKAVPGYLGTAIVMQHRISVADLPNQRPTDINFKEEE